MHQQKQQDKDEIQIHKFWQMFKQIHINITLVDALILILKYQKMLKALFSNKEKLLELANATLNENYSAVIIKKLLEKLETLGNFSFRLPELISTRMTLELANRAIYTPARISRDVFVLVRKFTFLANFVIVDYESDHHVFLVLGRSFLQIARALIDVHREEMILRDGDERLTLNMRQDTSSYSNQPQKESINMINIYYDSYEDYLKDVFATNHLSGNPTFSSHTNLTSPEVINPLSGSTTSSSPNHFLKEFADELPLITFPPGNDDLPSDIKSDLREIEYLLNHDPTKEMDSILEDSVDEGNLANPNVNLVDTIPEMFTDEHTLDYSSPPLYDEYDDDLVKLKFDNDDVYNDPFDSKEDKINESKLFIDELDPLRSGDLLSSPEYDSFLFEDFFEVDALPSTDNEDKEFADELPLITFPPGNDDLPSDIKSDLKEIEYLLNHDPTKEMDSILEDSVNEGNLANPNVNLVDTIPEMFTDEHTLDYSSPPLYDEYDDDLVKLEFDNDDVYNDPFDSKEDKINESKLFIDELDPHRSGDLLSSPEYDSFLFEDFSENLSEVTVQATPDKNVKKISKSYASLILEDFDPLLYELPFHEEVPRSETLLSFSSENKDKVFKHGILTSKVIHTSLLLELSHRGFKAFKVIKIFESLMEIFPCSYKEDILILDVSCNGYSEKRQNRSQNGQIWARKGKA
nr:hypothetical protein [Tanacetum cinerariifolium]